MGTPSRSALADQIASALEGTPAHFETLVAGYGFSRDTLVEATLVSAIMAALNRSVAAEALLEFRAPVDGWNPVPHGVDISLVDRDRNESAFIEVKWCNNNTVCEMMWDALKLACITWPPGANVTRLLAYAASRERHWEKGVNCARYFTEPFGIDRLPVDTTDFLMDDEGSWRYNLGGGGARPVKVPATLVLRPVKVLELQTDLEPFDLRVISVEPGDAKRWVTLVDGFPT